MTNKIYLLYKFFYLLCIGTLSYLYYKNFDIFFEIGIKEYILIQNTKVVPLGFNRLAPNSVSSCFPTAISKIGCKTQISSRVKIDQTHRS